MKAEQSPATGTRDRPVVVWFYRDLRLEDNPALSYAASCGLPVIPVFIWAPEEEAPWPPGAASRWWLHQSLKALSAELACLGAPLVLRKGPSARALETLIRETGARTIVWNRRYEPALIIRDTAIKTRLREQGLEVKTFNSLLLFEPWEIKTQSGGPYTVFTPFWKTCLKAPVPASCAARPQKLRRYDTELAALPLRSFALEPKLSWKEGLEAAWQPGSKAALCQFEAWQDGGLSSYTSGRDYPAQEGTSQLSPYLHFGEISPRQIWHALNMQGQLSSVAGIETFLRELGWREFAYHLLYHFPHTTTEPLRAEFAAFPWREAPDELARWQRGLTGFPLVDAGMRQLWTSGWMHNRVRMIVASFLCKHMQQPWQRGTEWFWDTLVDADLASNTLGWQWSAGCGADAAPYFRIFNPVTQSRRFDPAGHYLRRWLPELANASTAVVHEPWRDPLCQSEYPEPFLNLATARDTALASYRALPRG